VSARSDRSRLGNALVVVLLAALAAGWFALMAGDEVGGVPSASLIEAAGVLLVFVVVVLVFTSRRHAPVPDGADFLIVFASQTGFAEELAERTAAALVAGGRRVTRVPIARLDAALLARARVALFIAATYGEGDPPDPARRFADTTLRERVDLSRLQFGVLALGDRRYEHFCGFGRRLDAWLLANGARPLFDRIDVDDGDLASLGAWREWLKAWTSDDAMVVETAFTPWRLVSRVEANPSSLGAPAFHVVLEPGAGEGARWSAGDIAVVRLPDDQHRDYSIASLPDDGRIELLVRRASRDEAAMGTGARWLTSTLAIGATTALHIRANRGFRADDVAPSTPLILIGNGTGIAGLRAHVKARIASGADRNWLVFGERQAAVDGFYADEWSAWIAEGRIARASFAWSRDDPTRVHVQDRLAEERDALVDWIDDGAVVLVCGSATGMAEGVDATLRRLLGSRRVDALAVDGRYRRDVY